MSGGALEQPRRRHDSQLPAEATHSSPKARPVQRRQAERIQHHVVDLDVISESNPNTRTRGADADPEATAALSDDIQTLHDELFDSQKRLGNKQLKDMLKALNGQQASAQDAAFIHELLGEIPDELSETAGATESLIQAEKARDSHFIKRVRKRLHPVNMLAKTFLVIGGMGVIMPLLLPFLLAGVAIKGKRDLLISKAIKHTDSHKNFHNNSKTRDNLRKLYTAIVQHMAAPTEPSDSVVLQRLFMHFDKYTDTEALVSLSKDLIKRGYDINYATDSGKNALHCLLDRGYQYRYPEVIGGENPRRNRHRKRHAANPEHKRQFARFTRHLLSKMSAAAVNQVDTESGHTAFHKALLQSGKAVIRLFLNSPKLDVNQGDSQGYRPLHYAAYSTNLALCRELLQLGARLDLQNEMGNTALHTAALANREPSATLLVDQMTEAQLSIRNENNRTALDEAMHCGNFKVAKVIIRRLMTFDKRIKSVERHFKSLLKTQDIPYPLLVKKLSHPDVSACNKKLIAFIKQLNAEQLLVKAGEGKTLLDIAIKEKNDVIVQAIIKQLESFSADTLPTLILRSGQVATKRAQRIFDKQAKRMIKLLDANALLDAAQDQDCLFEHAVRAKNSSVLKAMKAHILKDKRVAIHRLIKDRQVYGKMMTAAYNDLACSCINKRSIRHLEARNDLGYNVVEQCLVERNLTVLNAASVKFNKAGKQATIQPAVQRQMRVQVFMQRVLAN